MPLNWGCPLTSSLGWCNHLSVYIEATPHVSVESIIASQSAMLPGIPAIFLPHIIG